jgi:hypothetical protein
VRVSGSTTLDLSRSPQVGDDEAVPVKALFVAIYLKFRMDSQISCSPSHLVTEAAISRKIVLSPPPDLRNRA